ncbi:LacI family DNA-binding transcriptional regulator [Enterococcus casseliflavus]|nr:LacI family DNA-binding transcriptional regulator [Enterococcus casseliflavus]WBY91476.1 LacI family DNA-binding transcriptional regulator [Enterococcus casseliflavus]
MGNMQDVAKLANGSVNTVLRVINKKYMSEETQRSE